MNIHISYYIFVIKYLRKNTGRKIYLKLRLTFDCLTQIIIFRQMLFEHISDH